MLGIVWLDEVMSELVGERKEPGFNHRIYMQKRMGHMEMEHTTIFGLAASHLSEHPGRLGCSVSVLYISVMAPGQGSTHAMLQSIAG
jgi:hypothetical protein